MKVLFHTNTLNYRGTTVAVTDYARYNQEVLGNESVIGFFHNFGPMKDIGTEPAVEEALRKQFKVVSYNSDLQDIERVVDLEKIDVTYMIKSGANDHLTPRNCKSAVHAVFQQFDPHGDRYAYISQWLSEKMTGGKYDYVPHIVKLPEPTANYRDIFAIDKSKIVIGRIGGYFSFDIDFVKEYTKSVLLQNKNFVFLFVGTQKFVDHPNAIFLNEVHDPQIKSNLINTCDVMLHARSMGESFGLAIAEFLYHNKPVLAWKHGTDLHHTVMLKDSGLLYETAQDIDRVLNNIDQFRGEWRHRVREFSPAIVINKFNKVFLQD